jgi:hypothetical protein
MSRGWVFLNFSTDREILPTSKVIPVDHGTHEVIKGINQSTLPVSQVYHG